jgi:RNA polymerase sigma factor (sigma-70 family)
VTESDQIAACMKGDQIACKKLFDAHKNVLFAICRRYLADTAEAEDALQESFILIFKNLSSYQGQGSFQGWMRKITVHCALGMIRKKKSFRAVPFSHESSPVDLELLQKMDTEELHFLINRLAPGRKQVFIAHAIDGFTHKEIGALLNISEGTSKSQFFDARREIRWALENGVTTAKKLDHGTR